MKSVPAPSKREEQKEDLLDRMNRHTVGKTGYVWIIDYEGYYVLSKGRQRDGENIWEAKDSDGNMVIQDLVGKGREVKGTEIAVDIFNSRKLKYYSN